jgi:hypothetical protein
MNQPLCHDFPGSDSLSPPKPMGRIHALCQRGACARAQSSYLDRIRIIGTFRQEWSLAAHPASGFARIARVAPRHVGDTRQGSSEKSIQPTKGC